VRVLSPPLRRPARDGPLLIEQLTRHGVSFRIVDGKVRVRPGRLLTDDERSELRRVKDEVQDLIREDDERRARGEAYIRDQGVAFELAREIFPKTQKGAA